MTGEETSAVLTAKGWGIVLKQERTANDSQPSEGDQQHETNKQKINEEKAKL